ncbi:hypothetical protein RJ639_038700 [Escallonia herrerae]|uniref:Reverse transcriptase Ty1/copia-type domain-containing protein n=1 Tax=Escallonia herrerae TaxID=1293975 RepID=A0AA88WHW2_9ASTE|nr:hypothetical protein RJ639_038700 [Escallonia herrerae]
MDPFVVESAAASMLLVRKRFSAVKDRFMGLISLQYAEGHIVEMELHEQRMKSADESTNEQSLKDPEEHPILDDGSPSLLTLYVDDMLIDMRSKSCILYLKKLLSREFDMKDLHSAKKILGKEIHRDRKSTTTLSTTEAKYMALTKATKETLWLKGLVEELGFEQRGILLQCDNQSAIDLTKNQIGTGFEVWLPQGYKVPGTDYRTNCKQIFPYNSGAEVCF